MASIRRGRCTFSLSTSVQAMLKPSSKLSGRTSNTNDMVFGGTLLTVRASGFNNSHRMNIARLRQLNARFQELANAMDAELAEPESARDPLALHIYHARRSYGKMMGLDTSKSGKRTKTELQQSFIKASQLGFRGGSREWFLVMMSGPTQS
jgi:hypothetical protein